MWSGYLLTRADRVSKGVLTLLALTVFTSCAAAPPEMIRLSRVEFDEIAVKAMLEAKAPRCRVEGNFLRVEAGTNVRAEGRRVFLLPADEHFFFDASRVPGFSKRELPSGETYIVHPLSTELIDRSFMEARYDFVSDSEMWRQASFWPSPKRIYAVAPFDSRAKVYERSCICGLDGKFEFEDLPPGEWVIFGTMSGGYGPLLATFRFTLAPGSQSYISLVALGESSIRSMK